jgi:signal transduction histidine kinase
MTGSIHRRVLSLALAALALGICLPMTVSWWLLARKMSQMADDSLRQVALAVAHDHRALAALGRPVPAQPHLHRENDGQFDFVTQVWSRDGIRLYSSDNVITLPFFSQSGLIVVTLGGEHWHLYTLTLADAVIQVAQRAGEPEALLRSTALTLIVPTLLMLAVVAGLLTLALRQGLAPLSQAADEVTARSVEALHPIALASHPPELRLLVSAINELMARLGAALTVQRDFVADAAHELRTPIAALRLQLQLLERAGDAAQRQAALVELRTGVARAQHLVEQLLQLSRLGPHAPALERRPNALAQLVRTAVSDFSARAEHQGVDLGAIISDSPEIEVDPQQLAILLNNLIDNALRHTPSGGKVDVAVYVDNGRPCIAVVDSGPGIAAHERKRVFDRFYRTDNGATGGSSGLGLAIVKAVAERHGATVVLDDAPIGGLRVRVSFSPT